MARAPRVLVGGGVYHAMNRGNRKEPIFLSEGDRILFLELVRQTAAQLGWLVYGYCLMENHYHLVVETPRPDLSAGMRTINGEYAQWFNRSHGFQGHVFQGRFKAVEVESDWHFLELSRYLALNPVRAGLCGNPAEWRWSSYPASIDARVHPFVATGKLLKVFGPDPVRAAQRFREFVEDVDPAKTGLFEP